ncbi:hypothetical protein [Citrobacter koseri]
MNKLQTIADMIKLAERLNAIVSDMEERKLSMLEEMHKKAA